MVRRNDGGAEGRPLANPELSMGGEALTVANLISILSFLAAVPSAIWALRELRRPQESDGTVRLGSVAPRSGTRLARMSGLTAVFMAALTASVGFSLSRSPGEASVPPIVAPPAPAAAPAKADPPAAAADAAIVSSAPPSAASKPGPDARPPAPANVSWTLPPPPKPLPDLRLAPPLREATSDAWLKARAAGLIRDFVARSGYPADQAVPALTAFYAPQVVSYGSKPISRYALMQEKEKSLFDRWPSRKYSIRPNTLNVACDAVASTCSVTGVLDWDYATRYGSSSFAYTVLVQGDQATIVKEDGATLERHDR
jgi:hypothetical protein